MAHLNQTATLIACKLFQMLSESGSDSLVIDNTQNTFMPVHLEKRQHIAGHGDVFSIAHYYIQQGDLMSDPYMEFINRSGIIHPILFEQHGVFAKRQEVLVYNDNGSVNGFRPKLQRDLVVFSNQWLLNIKRQQSIEVPRKKSKFTLISVDQTKERAFIKIKGEFQFTKLFKDEKNALYIQIENESIYINKNNQ
jgi:hypothetical protein